MSPFALFSPEKTVYVHPNYPTKKSLKDAVAQGKKVTVYQPNADAYRIAPPSDGTVWVEGPHYPEPHKWYGEVVLKDGRVVEVK